MSNACEPIYLEVPMWAEFLPMIREAHRRLGLIKEYSDAGVLSLSGPRLRADSWEFRSLASTLRQHAVPWDALGCDSKNAWAWRVGFAKPVSLGVGGEQQLRNRSERGVEGLEAFRHVPTNLLVNQFPICNGHFRLDAGYGLPDTGIRMVRFRNCAMATVPWTVSTMTSPAYDWGVNNLSAQHLAINILNAHVPPESDGVPSEVMAAGRASKFAADYYQAFAREFLAAVPSSGGIIPTRAVEDWVQERLDLRLAQQQARTRPKTTGKGPRLS